jgi:hypothetical protein
VNRVVVVDDTSGLVLIQAYEGASCITVPVPPLRALRLARALLDAAENQLGIAALAAPPSNSQFGA